jgi:hypothetical protein
MIVGRYIGLLSRPGLGQVPVECLQKAEYSPADRGIEGFFRLIYSVNASAKFFGKLSLPLFTELPRANAKSQRLLGNREITHRR